MHIFMLYSLATNPPSHRDGELAMLSVMEPLEIEDFLLIAEAVLDVEAERLQRLAGIGVAQAALKAPFAGFGDFELYPEPEVKIAILGARIVRYHPLPDGNKRTGFLAMLMFAERNELPINLPDDDTIGDVIELLAAGSISEDDFVRRVAPWFRR